jgi:hypothetical protein
MLTLDDYLTSSGKYPERAKHPECTDELKEKGLHLITKVNACLYEMGIRSSKVSSGFRPSEVNKKIKNAAKKSNHMDGDALDLEGQIIGKMLQADYLKHEKAGTTEKALLVKHGLYLEHPAYTPSWTHLQDEAPRSGNRVFIPRPGPRPS